MNMCSTIGHIVVVVIASAVAVNILFETKHFCFISDIMSTAAAEAFNIVDRDSSCPLCESEQCHCACVYAGML